MYKLYNKILQSAGKIKGLFELFDYHLSFVGYVNQIQS